MIYHQEGFLEASPCSEDLCSASGAVTPWFVPNIWHIKIGKLVLVWSRVFVLDSGKKFLRITYKIYIRMHIHTHIMQEKFSSSQMRSVCMCVYQHFEGTFLWHSMTQCHITQDIHSQKQQQQNIKHCEFNKRPGGNIEHLSCIIIYKWYTYWNITQKMHSTSIN